MSKDGSARQGPQQDRRADHSPGAAAPAAPAADPPPARLQALLQLLQQGRHDDVEPLAAELGELFPRSPQVLHLLGASRLVRQANDRALEALSRAAALAPRNPQVHSLLGVALFRLGRIHEARRAFDHSLALDPRDYETLVNAAAAALAEGDADLAGRLARQAVSIQPAGVAAVFALANAAAATGRHDEAVDLYRRAIALDPASADLLLNLGIVLARTRRRREAAEVLRQAVALQPRHALAHLNLGRVLHELGESAAAQSHFRAASDLAPTLAEAHSAYLFSLAHDETISPRRSYEEHLRIGDLIEAPFRALPVRHDNDRDPERVLRIGFVSGDLLDHPVANLIEPIWRAMKGGWCRVHAYSNRASDDPVAERLRALADDWVQVERMSDDALAGRIRADRIDILVDLSGHSARHRLPVFARKPAPVQMSWIGYPGTTGLSSVDYRLTRGSVGGESLAAQFREKLIHLRGARGFQQEAAAPDVNPLPALTRGTLAFASFNRPSKIGDAVIALWSRVMKALPGSTLLIAGTDDAGLEDRLRAAFGAHGVEASRLAFRRRRPLPQYLALHHEVDILLDTFPYAGGTTALHAIWMGVPTLALSGETMQQDQSAALLRMLGLSDWVADSAEAYVARAVEAAADLPGLQRLRAGLRERARHHLEGFPRQAGSELEAAFRGAWRRWCAGLPPESFTVGGGTDAAGRPATSPAAR
jgi:predicted O-linked N-acetylglucosamine transferase (SPINDLY family)